MALILADKSSMGVNRRVRLTILIGGAAIMIDFLVSASCSHCIFIGLNAITFHGFLLDFTEKAIKIPRFGSGACSPMRSREILSYRLFDHLFCATVASCPKTPQCRCWERLIQVLQQSHKAQETEFFQFAYNQALSNVKFREK